MCARVLGLMLWLVSASTVHIEIEARLGEDKICGQIRSDAGPPGSFTGWLGLICSLDALLSPVGGADRVDGVREATGTAGSCNATAE